MSEHGRVLAVNRVRLGSELSGAHAAGATVLAIDDGADFDENGGWLQVGDQTVAYTERVDLDDDTAELTLADSLDDAADDGDPVLLWDRSREVQASEVYAEVEIDGEEGGDPIGALVAHHLIEELPEGIRSLIGESVRMEEDGDDWIVVDVLGISEARGRKWEDDDPYILSAGDVADGSFTHPLKRSRIVERSMQVSWAGLVQPQSCYTVDTDAGLLTYTLGGFEPDGTTFDCQYQYLTAVNGASEPPAPPEEGGSSAWLTAAIATGALVAMEFDEPSGTTALDDSGNDRDGTYSAPFTLGGAPLLPGVSGSVDLGTAGYVEIPFDTWLGATGSNFSVEMIFQLDALPGTGGARGTLASSRGETNASSSFQIQVFNNKLDAFFFYNSSGEFNDAMTAEDLVVGVPYHAIVVMHGSSGGTGATGIEIHLNEDLAASVVGVGTQGPISRTRPLRIGNDERSDRNGADVKFGAFAFYNKKLSDAERATLFAAAQTA